MTTQIVFKIDPKIKTQAMERAKREGIPFAAVLKLATKAFAEGRFSVGIAETERFNKKTARELRAMLPDIEKGKNLSPRFSSVAGMKKYLVRRP
ncbi:MAG: hypothetical protein AAB471_01490 [Patescibacteria group bacterium]